MAPTNEWLIQIPDHPNMLSKRMEVRPYLPLPPFDPSPTNPSPSRSKHLEDLKPLIASGKIVFGGACLDEPLQEGKGMQTNGSAMMVVCETEKEAREVVEGDVYAKAGVWDTGNMKTAVRTAL
ncbi:uncharacterized protein LTR77_004614 [Saxophila tyrrhenica]|uniref:YCII-related domain-containing protein n=1 Tax=Saxophila tyrrhenica TaxID=1690608 RepID=A0AAV9PD57_9PEZI|nr:hypothetical protein LTR77_004614 [Saxophila tyrrhenica]